MPGLHPCCRACPSSVPSPGFPRFPLALGPRPLRVMSVHRGARAASPGPDVGAGPLLDLCQRNRPGAGPLRAQHTSRRREDTEEGFTERGQLSVPDVSSAPLRASRALPGPTQACTRARVSPTLHPPLPHSFPRNCCQEPRVPPALVCRATLQLPQPLCPDQPWTLLLYKSKSRGLAEMGGGGSSLIAQHPVFTPNTSFQRIQSLKKKKKTDGFDFKQQFVSFLNILYLLK